MLKSCFEESGSQNFACGVLHYHSKKVHSGYTCGRHSSFATLDFSVYNGRKSIEYRELGCIEQPSYTNINQVSARRNLKLFGPDERHPDMKTVKTSRLRSASLVMMVEASCGRKPAPQRGTIFYTVVPAFIYTLILAVADLYKSVSCPTTAIVMSS